MAKNKREFLFGPLTNTLTTAWMQEVERLRRQSRKYTFNPNNGIFTVGSDGVDKGVPVQHDLP